MEKQLPGRSRMYPSRSAGAIGSSPNQPPSLIPRARSTVSPRLPPSSSSTSADNGSSTAPFLVINGSDSPQNSSTFSSNATSFHPRPADAKHNDNVTVTVRFRPLSLREIQRGDDVGWYADGDNVVRMETNPNTAYAYDRVFGPSTTTRAVYDVAAQPIVSDAMEGMNGTVFAYGVTSSGKTHTMHGDQKSPGVIPLAVKEIFSIIQETPGRQFLLRVSYLEIYNEVINDLLNPSNQNLKIREDGMMGTYVENMKEEVVLSPAHALSLIAAGEEHRHVGSTNLNAVSSRSHTIFRLTIESTGTDSQGFEEVALSHLNLIDLAGSESSKALTSGMRRKEGSYINKSLLTLGTVISKLSEGKQSSHIPYRDSKLTRLLQSSLSGNGRISVICTVTPASGTVEETNNTLKFAQRAKHVEVRAEHNKIMDEKSLIKKYQREISELRSELLKLKNGVAEPGSDVAVLKKQLETNMVDNQLMQSRLEEEEQTKAALMGRIQRLTKLILVSTKNTAEPPSRTEHRRRLSFGEEDIMYLKLRKQEHTEEDSGDMASDDSGTVEDYEPKKHKRNSVISWLMKRAGTDSSNESPGVLTPGVVQSGTVTAGTATPAGGAVGGTPRSLWPTSPVRSQSVRDSTDSFAYVKRMPLGGSPARSRAGDAPSRSDSMSDIVQQPTQAGELFSAYSKPKRVKQEDVVEQIDLLREQAKILSGDVALARSNLKRHTEYKPSGNEKEKESLMEEIKEKSQKIKVIEQKIQDAMYLHQAYSSPEEMAKTIAKLKALLSVKTFDMEIIHTDNRILQDSLQAKTKQNNQLLEEINILRVQLTRSYDHGGAAANDSQAAVRSAGEEKQMSEAQEVRNTNLMQMATAGRLELQLQTAVQERDLLIAQQKRLTKDLAEARAVAVMRPGSDNTSQLLAAGYKSGSAREALADVAKLKAELTASEAREKELRAALAHREAAEVERQVAVAANEGAAAGDGAEEDSGAAVTDVLAAGQDKRGLAFQDALAAKNNEVAALNRRVAEARTREEELENDLATMWVLVAELRKHIGYGMGGSPGGGGSPSGARQMAVQRQLNEAQKKMSSLEAELAHLKGEYVEGLPEESLEELANLHRQALVKLSLALHKGKHHSDDLIGFKPSLLCRSCFERKISTQVQPCEHESLCQPCVEECKNCPTCLVPVTGWQSLAR